MKYFAALLLILACVGGFLWYQNYREERERRREQAWAEVGRVNADVKRHMDAELLRSEIHIVRLRLGELAAMDYELCKTHPPTVKENQVKCERLFAKVKAIEQRQPKW